jgi:hypothetical protein
MKAISLWQPWASLMEVGAKTIETRSWSTKYRGELAICASKRAGYFPEDHWGAYQSALMPHYGRDGVVSATFLPSGKVLGVVDLVEIFSTNEWAPQVSEFPFGDYSENRFGWITKNLRRLKSPAPVIGRQGLFNLPPEVESEVRRQMV